LISLRDEFFLDKDLHISVFNINNNWMMIKQKAELPRCMHSIELRAQIYQSLTMTSSRTNRIRYTCSFIIIGCIGYFIFNIDLYNDSSSEFGNIKIYNKHVHSINFIKIIWSCRRICKFILWCWIR